MKPHDWLFIAACACVALVLLFRIACRALDQYEGRDAGDR